MQKEPQSIGLRFLFLSYHPGAFLAAASTRRDSMLLYNFVHTPEA
jgi:hypothetical protein